MLLRPLPTLLSVAALSLTACGDDDTTPAATAAGESRQAPVANVEYAEAETYLERGGIALVRQAIGDGDASLADELDPRPAKSRRLATQGGREFDLLVFATPQEARAAWESLLDTEVIEEGGAAMRAVNLVVVFPEPAQDGVSARIKDRLRELADACADEQGDRELRELCFGSEAASVPPAGQGTATDELAPIGSTVVVGDVTYRVTLSRQLNPRIVPDRELVGDLRPEDGSLLYGVMLRACNEGSDPAQTAERLRLVSAFGATAEPVDLPDSNPFAYEPATLEPDACLPRPDSVADRAIDGRLVLFEIPRERLTERPLALEIVGPEGADRAAVQLDV